MPRYKELQDPAWLRRKYEQEGLSMSAIAAMLGCSVTGVQNALDRHDIPRRPAHATRGSTRKDAHPLLSDDAWLREEYETKRHSMEEIAARCSVTPSGVLRWLRKHGIESRPAGVQRSHVVRSDCIRELRNRQWLRHRYITRGMSAAEIAEEVGAQEWTVRTQLSKLGIRRREPLPSAEEVANGAYRRRNKGGYVEVYQPDHPNPTHRGFVKEHRLVAEQALRRHLGKREVVHHLNLDPGDNRESNLLVFRTNADHKRFHENPPAWIPRCECCSHALHEKIEARPEEVPIHWDEVPDHLKE